MGSLTAQAFSGGHRELWGTGREFWGCSHWAGDTGRTLTSDLLTGVAHEVEIH